MLGLERTARLAIPGDSAKSQNALGWFDLGRFVQSGPDRRAAIGPLDSLIEVLVGTAGTQINRIARPLERSSP